MVSTIVKSAVALGIAGTFAAATPAFAAPVLSSTATVKSAAPMQTTDVRWRGGGWGPGAFIGGLALGFAGAALAAPYYYGGGPYYYDYPSYAYGNGPVVYEYSYSYGPGYAYAPAYRWGPGPYRHWRQW